MNGGESMDLSGKFLIAMPGMGDRRFERSVILLCRHSGQGAMGLIVNKPRPDLAFPALLEQVGLDCAPDSREIRVHFGGPVELGRGFVLHSDDYHTQPATLDVAEGFALTGTMDILEALAKGEGPRDVLVALGYAGWGPGQLEAEILHNAWLTCDAPPELVFSGDANAKWGAALGLLGIDPVMLSAAAGRA